LEVQPVTDILAGLTKRRHELAVEAKAANAKLVSLLGDIEHLDGAIRTYDPAYRPRRVIIERATKLDVLRVALATLRKAREPMALRDIAVAVMTAQGGDVKNVKLMNLTIERVRVALMRQRKAGVVRSSQGPGLAVLWEVAK
jgi:hypothetical protein